MTTPTARIATALLGGTAALLALAAPAGAATSRTAGPDVSTQRLVLTPTDEGYVGTLTATVTNPGRTATTVDLIVTEPAGASFTTIEPGGPCLYTDLVDNRQVSECYGGRIEPHSTMTFQLGFHVWTTVRDYPMVARGGEIAVQPAGATRPSDTAAFTTLFASPTGELRHPRAYQQATATDLTIHGADVVLTRQPDGSLLGRMPVTVRYGNDAPSKHVYATADLPAGVTVWGTDPQDDVSFLDSFTVPGGRFMPGEVSSFDVILRAPAGTPADDLGSGSFTVAASYHPLTEVPDVDPADNTTSFTVRAVEAG
ncbi:hypothetical protein [Micromonospora sp. NPDC050495]|uniref:hypothetical protein n=1 Tax=Micromonospora sp. NPDC050495 TaxID=3154936 RepID=UPI0033F6FFF5